MALSLTDMSLDERFASLDDEKSRFVSKVYSGLTASLIVSAVCCALAIPWFKSMGPNMYGTWMVLSIVELVLVLIASFARLSGPLGWAVLMAFVACSGATLAPVLIHYGKFAPPGTVAMALGLTAGIFLTLTAYVRYSGKDFSFLYGFLWMGLIGLLISGIALIFFPSANVSYWRACIGALMFCGWILFDTSAVTRQYYRENNVVGAVLNLYLDIINLFIFLLQILGDRRRD